MFLSKQFMNLLNTYSVKMPVLYFLYILLTVPLITAFIPIDPSLACHDEEFMCQTGGCIMRNYVCNGINDCPNSEDENLKMCESHTCFHKEFRCNTGRCIPNIWLCDEISHCPNGEDENVEMCRSRSCSIEEFRCNSGRCIPDDWLCNSTKNCPAGEDENVELCGNRLLV